MRIIFMGTPEFALPTLQKLYQENFDIVAVYTAPPKAAGRNYKITQTPIHKFAAEKNLPVRTPLKLRNNTEEFEVFKSYKADIVVLVAYGLIIPKEYLEHPKFGFLNIHPSKLPRHRGAAPLQRTILEGDNETALCIMQMDEGLDTGDILYQRGFTLDNNITLTEHHNNMANLGAQMICEVLQDIEKFKPTKQSETGTSYANKISKEEGLIKFSKDKLLDIDRKIRALNPWPGSYFNHNDETIKIIEARAEFIGHNLKPGQVLLNPFRIACDGGFLHPLIVQRSGRSKVKAEEFIRGFNQEFTMIL